MPVPIDGGTDLSLNETVGQLASANDAMTPQSVNMPVDDQSVDQPHEQILRRELVFVDTAAADYQQLVDDLLNNKDVDRDIEVYLLDATQDGVEQITDILSTHTDLDAVHFVTHGTDGAVRLGSDWLRIENLAVYSRQIVGWDDSLANDADLLFYGCDLAGSESGQFLIESISELTGADVTASVDDTGHAFFGGDWDLEFSTGNIETDVAFSQYLQRNWVHLLNVTVDATSTGTTPSFASSDTVSHTTAGSDRLMLVGISFGQDKGDSVSSVTYNGTSLSLVGARDNSIPLSSRVEIWSLVAPDTGMHDVVVNYSGTNHIGATIGVMTFNGVDQATALRSFSSSEGDSTAPSTNVSSATDEVVFGVLALDHNADIDLVPGGGQTEHWDLWRDKATGGGTTESGAPTVVTSWSLPLSRKWAAGGVSIQPSNTNAALTTTGEFLVNGTTGDTQESSARNRGSHRAVAMADIGDYVVVWSSDNQDGSRWGVYGQRFDKNGIAQGSEFLINQTTSDQQLWATVATDDSGNFVAVWSSEGQDGDNPAESNVYARRYDAFGSPLSGEFLVNTTTTNGDQYNASIAMDADGDFVIVWEGNGVGDSHGVYGQRYDSAGTPLGGEFLINNLFSVNNQRDVAASMDDSGNFVVTWDDLIGFHARLYDNTGTPQGSQFTITANATAGNGSVAMDADGDFVAVWREDIIGETVKARRYDSTGTPLAPEFLANTTILGDQTHPSVAIDDAGNFIVVWEGNGPGDGDGVFGQKYDSAGSTIGGEFLINQTTSNNQHMTSLAMLDLNNFVVVWSGEGPGDTDGVFARQFGTANNPPTITSSINPSIDENLTVIQTLTATDPEMDPIAFTITGGDDGGLFSINGSDELVFSAAPDFETPGDFDTDNTYEVEVTADDGNGGTDVQLISVSVTDVVTLTTTGAATVNDGGLYTLNLGVSDPGPDPITSWTINWGDGTIDTIAGNPPSTTHTYNGAGFTYNILASVTDDQGATFLQNELLVASSKNDRMLRYGTDGSFLQEFATADGIDYPVDPIIGPDGNLYVSGWNSDDVLRYDPTTGAFIDEFVTAGSGGLDKSAGLAFGPDGNLYVASNKTSEVLRFQGPGGASPGAFIDVFADVSPIAAGVEEPEGLIFGPDGDLYVSDFKLSAVYKFDGITGAPVLTAGHPLGEFVAPGSGGLNAGEDLVFGPDGNLYVANDNGDNVLRYNGTTGTFIDEFVVAGDGGLQFTQGLSFGPDGNFYVGSWGSDSVLRYQGLDGATPGAFIDAYVSAGSGGLDETEYFDFIPGHQVTVTAGNVAPTITSSISPYIAENTITVLTVTATDPEFDPITFSLTGGADQAKFSINPSDQLKFQIAPDFEAPTDADTNNVYEVEVTADDGNGGTDVRLISVTVTNGGDTLWMSTINNVSGSGAPGLDSWTQSEVLSFADPNLAFESPTTDGTFSSVIDIGSFGGTVDVDAIHYVSTNITVGSANSIDLFEGDLLLSTTTNESLTSTNSLSVDSGDVFVFRPDITGDYTSGTFILLLDDFGISADAISLVEKDTLVGDVTLQAGTFIFTHGGATMQKDIYHFTADDVGDSTTSGTNTILIDGSDIDIDSPIQGLELVEIGKTVGGALLVTGEILVTLGADDSSVGDNSIATLKHDVFVLNVTTTGELMTAATATLFLDGSDVGLNTSSEDPDALTFFAGNEPPMITSNLTPNIDENLTIAQTLTATDPDFDPITFNITGGADQVLFTINVSDELVFLAAPDFEAPADADTNNIYEIEVTADDGKGGQDIELISVTVNGVNETPTADASGGGPYFINEGDSLTLDGSASSDPESLPLTYEWDLDNDLIFGEVGEPTGVGPVVAWTTLQSFGISDDGTYFFNLRVTDDMVQTDIDSVSLTVNNVVPTITSNLTPSLDENLTVVQTLTANDPVDMVGFSITGGNDSGLFFINGSNELAFLVAPDFEAPGDSDTDNVYEVEVTADDGDGGMDVQLVGVTVMNINEIPTITSPSTANVAENTSFVMTVTSTDVDGGPPNYAINGGADGSMFNIVGATGDLSFNAAPDFELPTDANSDNVYEVDVMADDGNGGVTVQSINVTVTDKNEPPTVTLTNTTTSLTENTDTSSALKVADIQVTDDGLGINTLTLTGADAGLFEISGSELRIKAGTVLDFETNPTLGVTVNVDDAAIAGNPDDSGSLSITIINVNEPPTISLLNTTTTLPEDTNIATPLKVAGIQVTDDGTGTNTLSLHGADANLFEITGTELRIKSGTVLDFETNPVLDVTVNVDDSGIGGNPDDSNSLSITITDVNDAPTVSLLNTTSMLPEDTSTSSAIKVADVQVEDDALGMNVLSLAGANASKFEIVGGDLRIKAGTVLDHETNPVLDVTVRVDDATISGNPDDAETLSIAITDVNEVPTVTSISNQVVLEDGTTGPLMLTVGDFETAPGLLTVTGVSDDQTLVPDAHLILAGYGANRTITVTPTNNEFGGPATITVTVSDGGLQAHMTFTVDVIPVNDPPVAVREGFATPSDQTLAGNVLSNDEDVDNDPLSAILVADVSDGTLTFNADGSFTYTPDNNFLGIDAFTYKANDGTVDGNVTTVTIHVAPPLVPPPPPERPPSEGEESGGEEPPPESPPPVPETSPQTNNDPPPTRATNREAAENANVVINREQPVQETGFESRESFVDFGFIAKADQVEVRLTSLKATSDVTGQSYDVSLNDVSYVLTTQAMWNDFDELKQIVDTSADLSTIVAGSTVTVSSMLTAGYVLWTIRGGYLLSSLLANIPAWQLVNPLLVLDELFDEESDFDDDEDGDESQQEAKKVETMFDEE